LVSASVLLREPSFILPVCELETVSFVIAPKELYGKHLSIADEHTPEKPLAIFQRKCQLFFED
jgi:hypothetical protein